MYSALIVHQIMCLLALFPSALIKHQYEMIPDNIIHYYIIVCLISRYTNLEYIHLLFLLFIEELMSRWHTDFVHVQHYMTYDATILFMLFNLKSYKYFSLVYYWFFIWSCVGVVPCVR